MTQAALSTGPRSRLAFFVALMSATTVAGEISVGQMSRPHCRD